MTSSLSGKNAVLAVKYLSVDNERNDGEKRQYAEHEERYDHAG
jgi:hypothetical protein